MTERERWGSQDDWSPVDVNLLKQFSAGVERPDKLPAVAQEALLDRMTVEGYRRLLKLGTKPWPSWIKVPLDEDYVFLSKLRGIFLDDWRAYAACEGKGDDLFDNEDRIDEAKSVCAVCPVRVECLDDALLFGDVDMVRGGLSYEEQKVLGRYRNRYFPYLKHDVTEAVRETEMHSL